MEINPISRIQKAALFCTKYSFTIGSVILLLFIFTKSEIFQIAGMVFMIAAFGSNLLVLFILFINLLIYPKYYLEILKLAVIMTFNIPVAIFYVWLATEFQRLTF